MELVVPTTDTVDLGRGYNTVEGRSAGWGLLAKNVGGPAVGGAAQYSYAYSLVESISDLTKALDLDANLSMRFGLFGADAKFKFAESSSVHDESLFVCLSIRVQRSAQQLKAPLEHDPVAAEIRKTRSPAEFRQSYGDAYVAAIRSGGELSVVLEIHTTSTTTRNEIATSLKGNYGVKVSADVSFKKQLVEQTSGRQVTVSHYQVGGTPLKYMKDGAPDVVELLKGADQFLDELTGEGKYAVGFEATLLPWATAPIIDGPSAVDVRQAEELLDSLALQQQACLDRLAFCRYVLGHPEEYDWASGPTQADLASLEQDALELLTTIRGLASRVAKDVQYQLTQEETRAAYRALAPKAQMKRVPAPGVVPDVRRLSEGEARAAIEAAGFDAENGGDVWSDDVKPGQVLRTNPAPGESLQVDSPVVFNLASSDEALKPMWGVYYPPVGLLNIVLEKI